MIKDNAHPTTSEIISLLMKYDEPDSELEPYELAILLHYLWQESSARGGLVAKIRNT